MNCPHELETSNLWGQCNLMQIVDGRTLVPARVIVEAIGKTVIYDDKDIVIEIK